MDLESPHLDCPRDRFVSTCDAKGALISWPDPEVTDNYIPHALVICTPPSGSVLPVGTTTVTCEGTDSCGHRSTFTFKVTVQLDTLLPGVGIDTDGNGLNDSWEIHYRAAGLAPNGDEDGDGLSNRDEMLAGTD